MQAWSVLNHYRRLVSARRYRLHLVPEALFLRRALSLYRHIVVPGKRLITAGKLESNLEIMRLLARIGERV